MKVGGSIPSRGTVAYTRNWRPRYLAYRVLVDDLKGHPCVDCGGTFPPECMDFDHLGDKKWQIGRMMNFSHEKVRDEIAKCDLVCANCHRIRTKSRKQQGVA